MANGSELPEWGYLTLVSYIPDPLSAFLSNVTRILPSAGNPRPHVTILPPRPLQVPVETASAEARAILQQFPVFDVELSNVGYFSQTNFLYLEVMDRQSVLHRLHAALNTGDLAHTEKFDFRPHLTLGGPVPKESLVYSQHQTEAAWRSSRCSPRFTISEVVCLWSGPAGAWSDWKRLWSQELGRGSSRQGAVDAATTNRTY